MRVLMTVDAVGGVWTYALDLARALDAHGVATTFAVMGPAPASDQLAAAASIPNTTLVAEPFQLEWMERPWDDVDRAGRWLLDLERTVAPDVVHLNGFVHAALPWRAPVLVAGHSCLCSWREETGTPLPGHDLARYAAAVRRGLQRAAVVAAPSATMLRALNRHYGPLPHGVVIHNGRRSGVFSSAPIKEPLVVSAGRRWDRAKNVAAVARVAPRLRWPLEIFGFADAAGNGRQPEAEVARRLSTASIFVLPARYEPFGLMPLEAALSGCALVLGDIPSLREVWEDAAVFVSPDDEAALADAVNALVLDDDSRRRMSVAAARRAAQFTVEKMADRYYTIYQRLAAQRSDLDARAACAS